MKFKDVPEGGKFYDPTTCANWEKQDTSSAICIADGPTNGIEFDFDPDENVDPDIDSYPDPGDEAVEE